ncbi:MAG: ABC transporter permease [Candidatus Peregrinibacteria bacterium]|nr:ABC transporter permease [Candidatus Peregrinibacteria bacterium]
MNYWHLLWVIAKTDFKLRYNGSMLGYVWAFLKPMLLFLVMYVVFSVLMKWNMPNYQLYLFLGIMIWNFFAEGTMAGIYSLLGKGDLIKKIYFPRILVVIACTLTAFMTLLLNIVVFFVFYFFMGLGFHWYLFLLPLALLLVYALVLGVSLFLSVLQVQYRDIVQIWEVLLQAGFFLTPIIYPLTLVPEKYHLYLYLNPMAGIMQFARMAVLDRQILPLPIISYTFVFVFVACLSGFFLFRRLSRNIAEKI